MHNFVLHQKIESPKSFPGHPIEDSKFNSRLQHARAWNMSAAVLEGCVFLGKFAA